MVIHGETKMLGDVSMNCSVRTKMSASGIIQALGLMGGFWIYFIFGTGLVSLSAGLIWVIFSIAEEILKN